jgi:hypothetical protein
MQLKLYLSAMQEKYYLVEGLRREFECWVLFELSSVELSKVRITLRTILELGKSGELSLSELPSAYCKQIMESYNYELGENYGYMDNNHCY